MTAPSLLIRADASVATGTGHAMRCLALAQAWQDGGGRAVFAMAESTQAICARLAAESCEVLSVPQRAGTEDDARHTIELAREHSAEWVVVDGYQFGADYQSALKTAGYKVLFVDDYGHAKHYSADLVLNQNVCATEELYANRVPQTRLLLGSRYCLLRREFLAWRGWKREVLHVGRRVLVTMGGSDPENLTARVITALESSEIEGLEVTVVVGGSSPHITTLKDAAARSRQKIVVLRDITNMAELMATADVAVSAAGSTCWELCLLGLPALLLDVAANQTPLARELDRRGCAIYLGDQTSGIAKIADQLNRLADCQEVRRSLSQRARELVDGNGSRRIVSVLRGTDSRTDDLCDREGLRLRRAQASDCRLLWEWANDPEVREASFFSGPIPWETHVAWFAERLGTNRSAIWIAEGAQSVPCGQIRFDSRPDGDWEVDISIARGIRGRGLAKELIKFGVQALVKEHRSVRVHAFVKPSNTASVKAFEKADFKRLGVEQIRGNDGIHLMYEELV